MNQKSRLKNDNLSKDNKYPKSIQKVFKPSNTRQNNNISRSKSRDKSNDKSPNRISKIIPLKATKINASNKSINRNARTPDRPINNTKHERSPNIIKPRDPHKYYTKTPSPLPKKSPSRPLPKYNRVLMTSEGHHNREADLIYGTSYNDYTSKNKIVNALNELNSEIKEIYYKNKNANNQPKRQNRPQQPGYYSTKHKTTGDNALKNNDSKIWLNTSDLKVSPLRYPKGKEVVDDNEKLYTKETKDTKASINSQFKSIRDTNSNYCYSFEDSRCSNSKNIDTIEEVHFVFVNLIQKSKIFLKTQENQNGQKEENVFDTVMKCDEEELC